MVGRWRAGQADPDEWKQIPEEVDIAVGAEEDAVYPNGERSVRVVHS